ncbi:MAG: glycosyltransferase family 4 protein [Sideroxydans sp.]|nr:glycosyltransferase family 4 protein [Sideroxydans sp.]
MSYIPSVIALTVSSLVAAFILRSKLSKAIQDIPNERSMHSKAVPRTGGVALLLGVFAGWSMVISSLVWWLVLPVLGLFALSMLDDIYNLPVKQRLLGHLAAAGLMVFGAGVAPQNGFIVAIILFFFTVWMTNLYNFMDGSDGLAGGMALFGFASYGLAAYWAHDEVLATLSFTVAAAALGFLFFNFNPAKIFMGDAGSIPLGFMAAAMGVWGWQQNAWAVWFPVLVFSPFIVDASITLLKRTLRGAKITEAHREHYYQRAVQLGAGHRKVALFEYVLMGLVGATAVCLREQAFPWAVLLVWGALYVVLMRAVDKRWEQRAA